MLIHLSHRFFTEPGIQYRELRLQRATGTMPIRQANGALSHTSSNRMPDREGKPSCPEL